MTAGAPFATDLWLPRYRPGRAGEWTLSVQLLAGARGYWGDLCPPFETAILRRDADGDNVTWMSIVPMEVESQEIGIRAARGHTVVLGLGMGWAAANIALNPAVTRVTVVERDPAIIALIADLGIFEQLPAAARDKIAVVEADAFDWRPDGPVDSLQADIWAKVVEPAKWTDAHRLQATIGAASLYFWGQEMELWRLACRRAGRVPDHLSRADLDAMVSGTGLPLIVSPAPDHGERIAAGARWWIPASPDWWRPDAPKAPESGETSRCRS